MSVRNIVIGGVLVVAAGVVAAAAIWYFAIREDAQLVTEAPAVPTELVESDAHAADGAQTFRIIPERSEAAYFADEQLASLGLPSTAKGATNQIEGEFYLTEDGLALAAGPVSAFMVDLTGLESDEDRRDTRVQETLETTVYPTASFTIANVTGYDPSVPDGEEQELALTGMLEIHGVRQEVTWEVKARREANVITALATITFRFDDFGMQPPSFAGFVSVEDEVTLQVQLVAEAV